MLNLECILGSRENSLKGIILHRKRYLTFLFCRLETSQLSTVSRTKYKLDAHGYETTSRQLLRVAERVYISRGSSALLVFLQRQCEGLKSWNEQISSAPRFFNLKTIIFFNMKKILSFLIIVILTAVLSPSIKSETQESNAKKLAKRILPYWTDSDIALTELSLTDPDRWGYTFIEEVPSTVRIGDQSVPAIQKIYKNKKGIYRSIVIIDENNFFHIKTNVITNDKGEEIIDPIKEFVSPKTRNFKRTIGSDTIVFTTSSSVFVIGQENPVGLEISYKEKKIDKRFDEFITKDDFIAEVNNVINDSPIYWGNYNSSQSEKELAMQEFSKEYITTPIISDREWVSMQLIKNKQRFVENRIKDLEIDYPEKLGWTFVKDVNSTFMKANTRNMIDITQKVYKDKAGNYKSWIIFDDDNYLLVPTRMGKDELTGEDKPDPQSLFNDFNIIIGKRKFGNNSIVYWPDWAQIKIGETFPLIVNIDYKMHGKPKSFINMNSESDISDQVISLMKKALDYGSHTQVEVFKNIRELYNKFTDLYMEAGSKVDASVPGNEILLLFNPIYITNEYGSNSPARYSRLDEDPLFLVYGDDKYFYRIDPQSQQLVKRIYLENPDGDPNYNILKWYSKDYIELNPEDYINDIKREGNIVTIRFNDNDYLKYSLYGGKLFEGKINRGNGILTVSHEGEGSLHAKWGDMFVTFTPNYDKTVDFYASENSNEVLGQCVVPAGSVIKAWVNKEFLSYLDPLEALLKTQGVPASSFVYDKNGDQTHKAFMGKVIWKDANKAIAQKKKAEMAAYVAKQKPSYDKLCAKYGKKYVNAVIKGDVIVGMPIALIQEVFENEIWHNYNDNYKTYRVWVRPALYTDKLKKISAKREAEFLYPFSERIIHVVNGRVSSISYY